MYSYKISLHEKPIPLARPRVTKFGTYNPQKEHVKKWKSLLAQKWPYLPYNGFISIIWDFGMPYPKSLSKRLKKAIEEDSATYPHVKKPDLSNLIKFVEDAMQGIIFVDDKQIIDITAKKYYCKDPSLNCIINTTEELTPKNAL